MVQTLALNGSHDLALNSAGSLSMLTGAQAVAAACQTACLTQLGECVLQTGYGLPNFSLIWIGTPDYALWQSYLENILLNVQGVTGVQSIALTAANHVLTYRAFITTIYDQQPILVQGNING
ncbi:MAG TPA: hypothetical protein VFE62_16130 [Gemmataceae bacterium]|nr:hypothetical protein [Gemmataceae bacterium]